MGGELTEITNHSVFTYTNEIIIELRGYTAEGEFTVVTYQFEPIEQEGSHVQPREPLDGPHEEHLQDVLTDAGYTLG